MRNIGPSGGGGTCRVGTAYVSHVSFFSVCLPTLGPPLPPRDLYLYLTTMRSTMTVMMMTMMEPNMASTILLIWGKEEGRAHQARLHRQEEGNHSRRLLQRPRQGGRGPQPVCRSRAEAQQRSSRGRHKHFIENNSHRWKLVAVYRIRRHSYWLPFDLTTIQISNS